MDTLATISQLTAMKKALKQYMQQCTEWYSFCIVELDENTFQINKNISFMSFCIIMYNLQDMSKHYSSINNEAFQINFETDHVLIKLQKD